MQHTVKKSRANRIALRSVGGLFFGIALCRLIVVAVSHERVNLVLTALLCSAGLAYGGYLLVQTFKPQAYDITYVFGDQSMTLKFHRGEKQIRYAEIRDLGFVVPNEELDYALVQIYIGREQYVIPFMGKSQVGKALYEMLKQKREACVREDK